MAKLYSIITSHLLLQTVFVVGVNAAFLLSSSSSSSSTNCSPIRLLNNNNHCNTVIPTTRHPLVTAIEASSSSDDSTNHAEAFTQYMAKSHEDKLRAVKAVEDKKNAEIEDLKRQIEEKKSGTTTTTSSSIVPANGSNGSMEVISAKLTAYQTFMSQYIVKAQDEKFNAIRAAEATISKKYEDKLSAFMLTGAADASSITISSQSSSTSSVVKESSKEPVVVLEPVPDATIAFVVEGVMKESVKEETKIPAAVPKPAAETKAPVVDSVKETKDKTKKPVAAKVEKKKPVSKVEVVPAEKSTADPPKTDDDGSTPPEVIAADHGLRADGGVGGLTLAERVSQGADSSAGTPVNGSIDDDANGSSSSAIIDPSCLTSAGTIIDPRYRVYFETMTVISTAAKAKAHNRWGPKEEQLATEYVAETLALAAAVAAGGGSAQPAAVTSSANGVVVEANQEPKPEVEEADHGLRADGGVGGPSLAQRVNLGAQLLNKT